MKTICIKLALPIGIAAFSAFGAFGQAAPDPAADLATLTKRAETIPNGPVFLAELMNNSAGSDQPLRAVELERRLLQWANIGSAEQLPVDIKLMALLPLARQRATYLSEILAADLDGDWSVTRQELLGAMSGQQRGISDIFVLGDKDFDNVLTNAELRAAVEARARADLNGRDRSTEMMAMFDLDDDGMLTQEELSRVVMAVTG